jgi:formate hydrogenlyase transcriptional activator
MDKTIETIPSTAMAKLQKWPWPGNVRELENIIERSVILSRGSALEVPLAELQVPEPENGEAGATLRDNEREHIVKMLRTVHGSVSEAATRLGMKRTTTLQSRMKKLEIDRNELGL